MGDVRHPLLRAILDNRSVTDGETTYQLNSNMDEREGALLQEAIRAVRPVQTLEVGMAYGISTLFICEALAELPFPASHVAIDPFQGSNWHGIGLRNVTEAGYGDMVRHYEERSEFVLPRLLTDGFKIQMALIDGWHTFDQALVEFYYINRMLSPGGIVLFDDTDWPSVNRVIRYVLTYPSYEVFGASRHTHTSLLGMARRGFARMPGLSQFTHPNFKDRSWDLGIADTCVALRKTGADTRDDTWFKDF